MHVSENYLIRPYGKYLNAVPTLAQVHKLYAIKIKSRGRFRFRGMCDTVEAAKYVVPYCLLAQHLKRLQVHSEFRCLWRKGAPALEADTDETVPCLQGGDEDTQSGVTVVYEEDEYGVPSRAPMAMYGGKKHPVRFTTSTPLDEMGRVGKVGG